MPIISSLLDTDLYKFTMMQVVWSRFPEAQAEYLFQCRSHGVDLRPIAQALRDEIDALGTLSLTKDECDFLRGIRFIQPSFVDYLEHFRLDPQHVKITTDNELGIRIKGPWLATILFEVPILAIINALWMEQNYPLTEERRAEGERRLAEKCAISQRATVPLRIMEFGTRRRYSQAWQTEITQFLHAQLGERLIGTSNVFLAKSLGLKPFGTMAHEFLQAGQAYAPLLQSQTLMLETWMQFYRGDLGIALSDVFGFERFIHDFDLLFTKAYDGCRHDSGDPAAWGERLIQHYEALGIDPRQKTAVFSDGLTIPKAIALATQFEGRIRTQFGIGTDLTNDLGVPALSVVLKLVRLNGQPVIKLSDTPAKSLTDSVAYRNYVCELLGIST